MAHKDWEAIEPEWRAGVKSVLQIAAWYEATTGDSISHTAINKHFKKLGIPRDFTVNPSVNVQLPQIDSLECAGFVYVIYLNDTSGKRFYKIGMAKHFNARFSTHQCASPFNIFVACAYYVGNMRAEERYLHDMFSSKHVRGEWFDLDSDSLDIIAKRARLI